MKKSIHFVVFILLLFSTVVDAQVIRPFAARYYNPSQNGSIVYVSNSIVSTSNVGPGSPGTGEVPPTGSTTNNAGVGINIDVDNTTTTLFPYVTPWRYLDNNTRPLNWQTVLYNDAAWALGNAEFGYGDGDEVTCVRYGGGYGTCPAVPACNPTPAGCNSKYITTYFRKVINIANPAAFTNMIMNVVRDDGIVIYVNGIEVARNNMPAGVPLHSTLASSAIGGAAESTPITFNLSPALFVVGLNTIAVEVHQDQITSSDLSFRMELQGFNDQGTFNSSTADLNLATCSDVLFAGLYWAAGEGSNTKSTAWIVGENTCKIKLPGAATYTTLVSTQTDYWNSILIPGYSHTGYQCFKDITSMINTSNPNGTYAVGNVLPALGIGDAYGGWTIVIVYANPSLPPRNLTVFDGCAAVKSGSGNVDIGINGFLTPPGGPVSCELGALVYDGDRNSQDGFQFRQAGAAGFYDLTPTANNPTSKANDMWNSVVAYKGAVVTTRNPAFQNTLGYDANIINLPNAGNAQLGNTKTSATVRFFSPSENYVVQVLTTTISQYTPTYTFNKSATDINGGTLQPGDSLRYQINFSNVGNDASTNTVITDNIPVGTTFIPGSIRISGVVKTDAVADDQADYDMVNKRVIFRVGTGANGTTGGNIGTGVAGNVMFSVVVASSCEVLNCIGTINNTARINYQAQTSGVSLFDSSGVNTAGCTIPGAVSHTPVGACYTPGDTLIVNICPVISVLLPWNKYGGYTIYKDKPFIATNIYDYSIPVSSSHVYWAYFNGGPGCSDTIMINMIITPCIDIDDDNDGIPDYVEFNNPLSLLDHNSNGIPNWNDPAYPGYVDNNSDNINDNFDWGADSDNDGIPNFNDSDFWVPWVDVNGDGVNDASDKDLDGIPNQYDLDSDNDGIPDTVESYGVDTNGDGIIDNYIDTDNDGFSQNVDANNTGVNGSGVGLGPQDLDGDGIPNYLDIDSDNDGIPDVIEAGGTDADNDGIIDGYVDSDGDGFSDNVDGDVGNDGIAENSANALLRTGPDTTPVDGRADSYPYKNMDNDKRANPYDLDSDGDGIVDVIEAGFPDTNYDGFADGPRGLDGWNIAINARVNLGLYNTDGFGNPDYLDIDADDDGIPDNIEGQTTASYKLPLNVDSDNDGIDNAYDAFAGFGGSGIFLSDKDGDNLPDYRDLDTDSDGIPDIVEGNDFNRNGIADDNVSLTFLDTDGDGLDNRFDSLNSVINIKGTSYNMGNGGNTVGDPAPGGRTPVQKTNAGQPDRDWRYVGYVLNVQFLEFAAVSQISNVLLNWGIISPVKIDRFEIERSTDNSLFEKVATVNGDISFNELQNFTLNDNTSNVNSELIYYRLKVIAENKQVKFSNVILVRKYINKTMVNIQPNPAADVTSVIFFAERESEVSIRLVDVVGKTMFFLKQKVFKGNNVIQLNSLSKYSNAVYSLQVMINDEVITKKLVIQNK